MFCAPAFGQRTLVLGDLQQAVGFSNGGDAAATLEASALSENACCPL